MARHKAREQTLQMLFQWDLRRLPLEEIARGYYGSLLVAEDAASKPKHDGFAQDLLQGVTEQLPAIDELITRHASNWRLERMPGVDRNVLRIAVYEMLRTDTPAAIVIDEAIELARRFAGEESVQFVNGVLDAIRREIPAKPAADAGSRA
jgi:N utilization substance protein B